MKEDTRRQYEIGKNQRRGVDIFQSRYLFRPDYYQLPVLEKTGTVFGDQTSLQN